MDKLEQCRNIHNLLIMKLKDKDYRRVGEILDVGIDDEPHIIKTMLICTKSFKDNEWIKEPRQRLVEKYKPKA